MINIGARLEWLTGNEWILEVWKNETTTEENPPLLFYKRETAQLENSDHYKPKQNKERENGRRRKHVNQSDLFVI